MQTDISNAGTEGELNLLDLLDIATQGLTEHQKFAEINNYNVQKDVIGTARRAVGGAQTDT